MSTEATGDGQAGQAGQAEPDAPAESAQPAAGVVTGARVVTGPAVTGPPAWEAASSAWGAAGPAEVPEPAADAGEAADASAGEAAPASGRDPAPDETPVPQEDGEPDEAGERYAGYSDNEAAEYDEEAYEAYAEYGDDEYDEYGQEGEYEQEEAAAPPRARRWPRVLLGLGFVALGAVIVGGAIAIVGSVTHGFKKPVKITYTKSALFNLKTGECFDPHGQSYTLIACDSPHVAEVFATFALSGAKWPGAAAAAADASHGCATRLTGYLNPQLAISLSSTYVYPDPVAWQAGTRTVICEVRATSGDLTGSVRGASATAG